MKPTMYKYMMMLAAMGTMMDINATPNEIEIKELTNDEIEEIKRVRSAKVKMLMLKRGMSEYTIDGITVIALNENNAIRKVKRIKAM